MLAGPRDFRRRPDTPFGGSWAAWFRPWTLETVTPKDAFRGLVSDSDGVGAIQDAWRWLRFGDGVHFRDIDDDDGQNGHEEIISDARYSADRTRLCFSGDPLPVSVPAALAALGLACAAATRATLRARRGGARSLPPRGTTNA